LLTTNWLPPGTPTVTDTLVGSLPYWQRYTDSTALTPALVRTRPLKARHFLRDGAELAYPWHAEQMRRISTRAVAEISRI
jgi:hypothetical protein